MEPGMSQNAPDGLQPAVPPISFPSPLDGSVGLDGSRATPGYSEVEVGPLPEGVEAGHFVTFTCQGLQYEVMVPEGFGPGSCFRATVPSSPDDELYGCLSTKAGLKGDGLANLSDDSTCAGEVDTCSDEDPMWSADWTADCYAESHRHDTELCQDGMQASMENACVEQLPDCVTFENCALHSRCCELRAEAVEVFDLSNLSWCARLQQRREQAVRSGKKKLVLKIDKQIQLELEKTRQLQDSVASKTPACSGQQDAAFDGIWAEDWVRLPASVSNSVPLCT